jgi:multidrug efflux pump subunit AcrB
MPEGTSLEATGRVLEQAATVTRRLPEVTAMEAYAGTSAPFNFNGLVRHYFLRSARDGRSDGHAAAQG